MFSQVACSEHVPMIGITHDGIHPTDSAYHLWIAVIVAGIESALTCDGALSREPH